MNKLLAVAGLTVAGLMLGQAVVKIENALPGGCESGSGVPSAYEGGVTPPAAYLKANPVPKCPGMVVGVPADQAFQARAGVAGDTPWTETLATAGGRTITVTCGSVPGHRRKCAQPMPDLFTYQYVPVNGDVSQPGSIIPIRVMAGGSHG